MSMLYCFLVGLVLAQVHAHVIPTSTLKLTFQRVEYTIGHEKLSLPSTASSDRFAKTLRLGFRIHSKSVEHANSGIAQERYFTHSTNNAINFVDLPQSFDLEIVAQVVQMNKVIVTMPVGMYSHKHSSPWFYASSALLKLSEADQKHSEFTRTVQIAATLSHMSNICDTKTLNVLQVDDASRSMLVQTLAHSCEIFVWSPIFNHLEGSLYVNGKAHSPSDADIIVADQKLDSDESLSTFKTGGDGFLAVLNKFRTFVLRIEGMTLRSKVGHAGAHDHYNEKHTTRPTRDSAQPTVSHVSRLDIEDEVSESSSSYYESEPSSYYESEPSSYYESEPSSYYESEPSIIFSPFESMLEQHGASRYTADSAQPTSSHLSLFDIADVASESWSSYESEPLATVPPFESVLDVWQEDESENYVVVLESLPTVDEEEYA